jgi:hypothetical protein
MGLNRFVAPNSKGTDAFMMVDRPVFSADGRRTAFAGSPMPTRGGPGGSSGGPPGFPGGGAPGHSMKTVVIVGDQRLGERHDAAGAPVFGARGRAIAYKARAGKEMFVVLEGRGRGPGFAVVGTPVLGPKGRRVAYAAARGITWPEGALPDCFRDVEHAARGGRWVLVIDKTVSGEWDRVRQPAFDSKGRRVVYAARREGRWHVVVGSQESPPFDEVYAPRFAADGKRVIYGARSGRKVWRRVLDLK